MNLLSRRSRLAVAAVVDVALHARPQPVAAKALANRHNLPPRHLETLLQALVKANILKGVRGPRGGYEHARERRRISAGDIVRAAMSDGFDEEEVVAESQLVREVVTPMIDLAGETFLAALDAVTVDDLCRQASERQAFDMARDDADFTI